MRTCNQWVYARRVYARRISHILQSSSFFAAIFSMLLLSGCATVGQDFSEARVGSIRIGESRQDDIQEMFGSPWRTGIEDGQRTWTYGKYKYSLFTDNTAKDLIVRFNDQGVVTSYSYNTTEHQR